MNIEMRKRRKALNLTLWDLAARVKTSFSWIQAIEGGRGRTWDVKKKLLVARALGAEPLDLFPELLDLAEHLSGRGWTAEHPASSATTARQAKRARV